MIGGGIARTVTKIMRKPSRNAHDAPALLGITGDSDVGMELREWWLCGALPASFPQAARNKADTTLVVIQGGRIATYCSGPYPLVIEAKQAAWGSGRDFAEAAMHLGCDARRAVEVACHFQSDCGNGIDVLELA